MSDKIKTGVCIAAIGYQGCGKSPTLKDLCKKANMKNNIVFDPNKEYDTNEYTIFYDFETFKDFVYEVEESFIIFEEATGYIGFFSDLDLKKLLIACEHRRNIICFVFHDTTSAPLFLLGKTRFIYLFDVYEDETFIKRNRPLLFRHLKNKKPNKYGNNVVLIDNRAQNFT